jgi:hypothetical protein
MINYIQICLRIIFFEEAEKSPTCITQRALLCGISIDPQVHICNINALPPPPPPKATTLIQSFESTLKLFPLGHYRNIFLKRIELNQYFLYMHKQF